MAMTSRRALSPRLFADLTDGLLAPIRSRVVRDRTLCLELRGECAGVYYRGGRLMNLASAGGGYSAGFDERYFEERPPVQPSTVLRGPADVEAWLAALPGLKDAMDRWLGAHPKEEREIQQWLLRDNNFGTQANDTDFYVCDIEYANEDGRFDFVAVHWSSTPTDRRNPNNRRLVLGELKVGDDSLEGSAGLHAHVRDVNAFGVDPILTGRREGIPSRTAC